VGDDLPFRETRAWRSVLGRRLVALNFVFALLSVIILASGFGAGPGHGWWVFGLILTAVLLTVMVWRSTSNQVRGGVAVGVLVVGATLGYARFGPTPGSALALALAVMVAGLLLGKRALAVTISLAAVAVATVGALMVRGHLAPPVAADISPLLTTVWIRTSIFTILVTFVLATTVMWVVEHVEEAAARAEREIERRHDAERKALQAQQAELMGQVAGGLAHDVNNHLAVISMWSSVLLASRDPEDVEEAADEIGAAIEHATALTRRLLVIGRRGVRNPRPLSLTALVDDHATMMRKMLGARIALVIEPPASPAWCQADEGQLDQVLLNLVMNARDAMPDGGTLKVRTGQLERDGAAAVFLEVEDAGLGMTAEVLRRASEPFFTTKPPGKGSGLGLAAVAAIARQSGGELVLSSTAGAGTLATVFLPAIAGTTADASGPVAAPILVAGRVLLVDDSAALVQVARRILIDAGCTVVVASDGDEAMQRIREGRFDLLCSDVVMPGCPTRDLIAAFEDRNPGAPVLLCSGYVDQELVRRGIEAGRYRFLAKPYGPTQLLVEVATLLRASGDDPLAARGMIA